MRSLLIILILAFFGNSGLSQKIEFCLFGGISNYTGDINKENILFMTEVNPVFGIQVKKKFNPSFSVGAEYMNASLSGTDQNFEDRKDWNPNLSFSTSIHEFNFNFQWSPLFRKSLKFYDVDGHQLDKNKVEETRYNKEGFEIIEEGKFLVARDNNKNIWVYNNQGDLTIYTEDYVVLNQKYNKRIAPYMTAGVGVLITSPEINGLPEEAPELEDGYYGNIYPTIPIGGGLLFDLHPRFNISTEITMRYAFTDHLDGVSVSRDPNNNDWYLFAGLRVGYSFGKTTSYKNFILQ